MKRPARRTARAREVCMPYFMYVAVRDDDKLVRFTLDPDTGLLKQIGEVAVPGGPAPLAIDPRKRFLYVGRRRANIVSSFSIEPGSGDLTQIGEVPLESDPCYMSTDRAGRFLLSAYYGAGHVSVHAIGDNGAVGGPPVEWRATAPGAHCFQ